MARGIQRLTPKFVERIWGSKHLEPLFPNQTKDTGEVWLEATAPFDGPLPLLVKFIFTTGKLSVQVHPPDEYAALHHNSKGKTEMWHVLAAEPGAQVAAGFMKELTIEQLRAAALSGEIEHLLQWYDARPGDTFFLPAGTVHAIGEGLVMCEIQQQSDITYRLYDYGRGRELHLDHALAVSHLEPYDPRAEATEGLLVACDYFTTSLIRVRGRSELPGRAGQFVVVIGGKGHVAGDSARAGDAWFAESGSVTVEGQMDLIVAFVPTRTQ
jgi:mannose-6-phosphate isomerase